jgi:hypothetical protein
MIMRTYLVGTLPHPTVAAMKAITIRKMATIAGHWSLLGRGNLLMVYTPYSTYDSILPSYYEVRWEVRRYRPLAVVIVQ